MKSSLKKLRSLATQHHKGDPARDSRDHQASVRADELAQASQDMQDMRDCYDGLLSAAAATANSAYEFSESLRELGTCLLEKIELSDDEESGRVMLLLGKAQFELQKLIDRYRLHIMRTITTPSESLLNELRTVEEMKQQCDEKRDVFNYVLAAHKEKKKSRNSKDELFSSQQLRAAKEEYDQEATLFIFRLKSLKQGQSQSLLTQAARHHAAQLNFFRKGNKTLEAVEPHVKIVAGQQHINYQFNELEDDAIDHYDAYSYEANDEGELSFDHGQFEQGQEVVSASRISMELDQTDYASPLLSTSETTKENQDKYPTEFSFSRAPRYGSQSAPLFPEKKINPGELLKEIRPSYTRMLNTYVLPTPTDSKRASSVSDSNPASLLENKSSSLGPKWPLLDSSPTGQDKTVRRSGDSQFSGSAPTLNGQPVVNENKNNSDPIRLPPPLADRLSLPQPNQNIVSDSKKIKRHSFSDPLTSKACSSKPMLNLPSVEHPPAMPMQMTPRQPSTSPKVSPGASPPLTSPTKISELHELPRPPPKAKTAKTNSLVGHSAPLMFRGPDNSASKVPSLSTHVMASPLPTPPGTMARSFSIPSRVQRIVSLSVSKLQEADKTADVASPPLAHVSLTNIGPTFKGSLSDAQGTKPTSKYDLE